MTRPSTTGLYVDDEELLELLSEYVHSQYDDITLLTARTGQEAIDALETVDSIEWVISDYEMPDMDDLEVLDAVRQRWTDLPFILFTGQGDENLAQRAINAGVGRRTATVGTRLGSPRSGAMTPTGHSSS